MTNPADPTKPKHQYLVPEDAHVYETWLANATDRVRAISEVYPLLNCYREPARPAAHYLLTGYSEPKDTAKPMAGIVTHGADSFLPGVQVSAVELEALTLCGCGNWLPPTPEQQIAMQEHFEALERARALAPKPPKPDTKH